MLELTTENFEREVINSQMPVLVVFTAPWCGYCHSMLRGLEMIKERLEGVKVTVVNIEESREIAEKYSVANVPTSVVFRDGKETERATGLLSKARILYLLKLR